MINFWTLFLVLSLIWFATSFSSVIFDPQCNIHERPTGYETPKTLLLGDSTANWLHPLKEMEILEYYEQGKAECEAYLSRKEEIAKDLRLSQGTIHHTEQISCFGRALLYNDFGMILWPFGPYKKCTTYSTCWFGVLSCGGFNKAKFDSHTRPAILKDLSALEEVLKLQPHTIQAPGKVVEWSLKSIVSHLRVIGTESVTPDRRLYSFQDKNGNKAEAIIGKYVLTIPAPQATLEIRLMEMYPSLLYNWRGKSDPQSYYQKYGLHNLGAFFLFGGDCKYQNHRHCPERSHLPFCDNYSHLMHSPFQVTIEDGLSRCPDVQKIAKSLPLCSRKNTPLSDSSSTDRSVQNSFGNAPGRWIQGASSYLSPNCVKDYPPYNVVLMDYISDGLIPEMKTRSYRMSKTKIRSSFSSNSLHGNNNITSASDHKQTLPLPAINRHNSRHIPRNEQLQALIRNQRKHNPVPARQLKSNTDQNPPPPPFDQASGNPCISTKGWKMPEELNVEEWFYAPYHCKYHFYTREELMQCFTGLNIHHIHFHGDSLSRELFLAVARYLGVNDASGERLKYITNMLRKPHLQFTIEDEEAGHSLLVSLGYAWEYSEEVVKLIEVSPYPDVYVTNHYLAHRTQFPVYVKEDTKQKEWKYWEQHLKNSTMRPRYLFFQNGRDLQGQRGSPFIGNILRENSELLRQMYVNEFGFMELDEFLISVGKFENYNYALNDGWHTMANIRGMEVFVMMNMICNDWWIEHKPEK